MDLEGYEEIACAYYNFSRGKDGHDISISYFASRETYDNGTSRKYVIKVMPNLFVRVHCSPESFGEIKDKIGQMIDDKTKPDKLVEDIESLVKDLFHKK